VKEGKMIPLCLEILSHNQEVEKAAPQNVEDICLQ
jgi:hypothetical protein